MIDILSVNMVDVTGLLAIRNVLDTLRQAASAFREERDAASEPLESPPAPWQE